MKILLLCCRAEAGITIDPENLEDPAIFDDLVDSGLLNLEGCLAIGEVLGATLKKTGDSLCPLTLDNVEGIQGRNCRWTRVKEGMVTEVKGNVEKVTIASEGDKVVISIVVSNNKRAQPF